LIIDDNISGNFSFCELLSRHIHAMDDELKRDNCKDTKRVISGIPMIVLKELKTSKVVL
jgi:hypothetical protein